MHQTVMDASPGKAHHSLTGILFFSVLIHCALLSVPISLKPDTTIKTGEPKTITVQIINSKPEKKPIEEPVIQALAPPEPVDEQPAVSATSIRNTRPQQEKKAQRPLDLSLPGDNNYWPKQPQGGLTRNGAVVMNGELLKQLNEGGRSASVSTSDKSFVIHSFANAGQIHFMNIAGRCFKVIEANPQDALSYETWWPVKCQR